MACSPTTRLGVPRDISARLNHTISDLRELDVLILADEEFESVLNWRERGKKALDQAAADFEFLFGLGIKAKEFGSVQSNNSLRTLDDLAGDLEAKLKT